MNHWHAMGGFLGLNRSILGLLAMVILVGLGEKMAERFLPLYLVALGGGALSVGLLNALDNLLSALYAFPGGYLADRLGIKRALLVFNGTAMAGFLVVVLVPRWEAVIAGAVLFLSWSAVSLPATMDLVAKALPREKRTMGVSVHSLVRRIPMAVGPLLGGAAIGIWGERDGVRAAFGVALAMAALAMFMQQRWIQDDAEDAARPPSTAQANPLAVFRGMSPPLRGLLVSDILVRFCEQIPYAFVVLWCTRELPSPVSALEFGVLTAVEMGTAVAVYIPVAHWADRMGKRPFVLMTFLFFTLFPLALLLSRSFPLLLGAFVLRGLKEFGEPARKALILDLAPEGRKAATFGLYYLIRDVVVSGAAFGGAFLWLISPAANFLAASAFGMAGTLWFAVRGRDIETGGATLQTP